MKVVTFYSFKGGVGRSTALANVAYLLATTGLRVVCTDFDIEAPGLHFVFDVSPGSMRACLQEYLVEHEHYKQPHKFSRLFVDVATDRKYTFDAPGGSLKLLPAGIRPDLNDKINVDMDLFLVVQVLYDSIETYLQPDVLLIDSRSGISSLALPAQMSSDAVLVMHRLGRQQITGTENTVEWLNGRYRKLRGETIPILLACSNVPVDQMGDRHQHEMSGLSADLRANCSNEDIRHITTVFSSPILAKGEQVVVDKPHQDMSLYNSYSLIAKSIREAVALD